ncbi:sugar transferase [Rhodopseudomonas palustris]|uniref:Undecaprenyl-phosphate galactose phosphotransferase n=1 Tax=Rhodopseudomonas palustris (strain DX-1) TaxID=652103 RepID=E6VP86_RHOPX|nr:sugar transferase [Rhodopseudomonas palustris]QDL98022.1 sugar transferase [Rhodopseudomonas palustris]
MDGLLRTDTEIDLADRSRPTPVGCTSKRALDLLLALSGLVILAPLLLLCYLATMIASPGPAMFRHRRVGFNGQTFDCLKFRTMAVDANERLQRLLESDPEAAEEWRQTQKLRRDPRVTLVGAALRKSSLDELPQLINVLKGEMSIVGPRPVTAEELSRYGHCAAEYLACRPGLTGLWQVSGRNTTTYDRRVALDSYYANNWSHRLDLRIILVTIPTLLTAYGAY